MMPYSRYVITALLVIVSFFVGENYGLSRAQSRGGDSEVQKNELVHADAVPPAKNSTQSVLVQEGGDPSRGLTSTVAYIREHHALPDFYLTKAEASARGWVPSRGNLCDVVPGMMIGGDVFTNRQHLLPVSSGRTWYEADFEYECGNRNAKRILFSDDGLIFITVDHYQTVNEAQK
jgi:ribonuclease